MIFETSLKPHEVIEILSEQMDDKPSWLKSIVTFNAYGGTSAVIGTIRGNTFHLRNRRYPYFSVTAIGEIIAIDQGSEIKLTFKKSKYRDFLSELLLSRSEHDKKVIIRFLEEWLKIKEKVEQPVA